MVEVFYTNVVAAADAREILDVLHQAFPDWHCTIDLQDVDRVLRVEGELVHEESVIEIVCARGWSCDTAV